MTKRKRPECEGNIDPSQLIVDQQPKRRRKRITRKQEPMPDAAKPWVKEAYRRKANRPVYPGVMLEPTTDGGRPLFGIVSPIDDEEAWINAIADAFGTRSRAVIGMFFEHLSDLCRDSYDHSNEMWKPNERHLNAAIAVIHASRPKDELDAMLCAQAVAIHWMQMRVSANLIGGTSGYLDPRSAGVCARLAQTFAAQVEAIDKRKRKPRTARQVITVRREVHYHQHKHVHLEGGGAANGGQPHATEGVRIDAGTFEGACKPEDRASLPSPNACGQLVPLGRGEGQEGVPNARRGSRIRRATGQD